MGDLFQPVHLLILLVVFAFVIIPFWKIFKKAGFPAPLAILMIFPFLNVVLLYVLAFSTWKKPSNA